MNALACLLCILALVGSGPLGAQSALEVEREAARGEHLPDPPAGPDSARPPVTGMDRSPVGPDERSIWYHLHRGDIEMMNLELERISQSHPGWVPQGDLARAIADTLRPQSVEPADAEQAPAPPPDPCDDPASAWRSARESASGAMILESMLVRCNDTGVALGTLERLLADLSLPRQLSLGQSLTARNLSSAARKVLAERLYQLRLQVLAGRTTGLDGPQFDALAREAERRRDGAAALTIAWHAIQASNAPLALAWFERAATWGRAVSAREGLAAAHALQARVALIEDNQIAKGLEAIRDSRRFGGAPAEPIAWSLYELGRWLDAEQVFRLVDDAESSVYGRGLSLGAAGRHEQAAALVCETSQPSTRVLTVCTATLEVLFFRAWEARDIKQTLELGGRLERKGSASDEVAEILAWAHLERGEYDEAANRFALLVGPDMSADLASGAVRSFEAANRRQELSALAARSPVIADNLRRQQAVLAKARDQYGLYAELADTDPPGIRRWIASSGFETSDSRGTPGQGRAVIGQGVMALSSTRNALRVDVGLRRTRFDAGWPATQTALGFRGLTSGAADARRPSRDSQVDELLLRARLERPGLSLDAAIGTGLRGGVVAGRPTFSLAVTGFGERSSSGLTLARQTRRDSLLAFSGQTDPVSGRSWGGVLETSVRLQHYWVTGDRTGLTVTLDRAWLTGKHVKTNKRNMIRLDYGLDLTRPGWTHLRAGPFASFAAHDRNLSHYTFGHGGYFSPERDLRTGFQVDALTKSDRNWIARLRASVAWADTREASAPRFPGIAADTTRYAAARNRGLAGEVQAHSVWLVAPHVMLSLTIGVSSAPRYDRWWLGLGIQIPFEQRSRVTPGDLHNAFDRGD